jgi:hypothetical protein
MIRFLDLPAEYHELKTEIGRAVGRVLESGQFVGGTENAALEEDSPTITAPVMLSPSIREPARSIWPCLPRAFSRATK